MPHFIIDTSIWIDLYENRTGYNNEPLGKYALKLIEKIILRNDRIIITDLLVAELKTRYSMEQINGMFKPFENLTNIILVASNQKTEAKEIAMKRNVPFGDALHTILARDNKLILITRDKHFKLLEDISKHYKPENII